MGKKGKRGINKGKLVNAVATKMRPTNKDVDVAATIVFEVIAAVKGRRSEAYQGRVVCVAARGEDG